MSFGHSVRWLIPKPDMKVDDMLTPVVVKYIGDTTPTTLTNGERYTVKEIVTYGGVDYIAINEDHRIFPAEDFKDIMLENIASIEIGQTISFTYTNWKGITATRTAKVLDFGWGVTPWHPEPQWIMLGLDSERNDGRKYAMRDMKDIVVQIEESQKDKRHPFVATPDNGPCSSCGRKRSDAIHEL